MLHFTVNFNTKASPVVLLLAPIVDNNTLLPDQQQLLGLVCAWLQQFSALTQLGTSTGTDWLQWRFCFSDQMFILHFEHYTESFWIEADTELAVVLLSELACYLQRRAD